MLARATFVFVAVLLTITAAAPAQDVKQELEKLQGDWTVVSLEILGKPAAEATFKTQKLLITGDHGTFILAGGQQNKFTMKIDPSKDPKTIDLTIMAVDGERISRGIYKLEGDTLTICRTMGTKERPKEFKTSAQAGGMLVVHKRVTK
jgi:uncharacterized protein (TIGR03067 family)